MGDTDRIGNRAREQWPLTRGDFKLQYEWLEKHKDAQELVYDTVFKLPLWAVYTNPVASAYVEQLNVMRRMVEYFSKRLAELEDRHD